MASEADIVERIARALHADDYPHGEWEHVKTQHKAKWRAMARTVQSTALWGDFVDAAKRLANWDDVDRRREPTPFAERADADMWLRRAEVGFAALRGSTPPAPRGVKPPSLLDLGFDDGA